MSKGIDLAIGEAVEDAGCDVTEETEGYHQALAVYDRPVHRLTLTVSLATLADRRTLQRFYLTTCAGSARVFEFVHPKSGQVYAVHFDPDSPPVWTVEPRQPDKHHAEIALLEDLREGYLTGIYDV